MDPCTKLIKLHINEAGLLGGWTWQGYELYCEHLAVMGERDLDLNIKQTSQGNILYDQSWTPRKWTPKNQYRQGKE